MPYPLPFQRRFYINKAEEYLREAEEFSRKAEVYIREATYYDNKAKDYLREADYCSKHQNRIRPGLMSNRPTRP